MLAKITDSEEIIIVWREIEAVRLKQKPAGLKYNRGPASLQAFDTIEYETGLSCPYALRGVLSIRNGEEYPLMFDDGFRLLSAGEIVDYWKEHVYLLKHLPTNVIQAELDPDIDEECSGPVRPLIANTQWLPFADDNGDRTRYFDFDPAPGGVLGQIIEVHPEATIWRVLAPSFLVYLLMYLDKILSTDRV